MYQCVYIDIYLICYISDFTLYLGLNCAFEERNSFQKVGEMAFPVTMSWTSCHHGFEFDIQRIIF